MYKYFNSKFYFTQLIIFLIISFLNLIFLSVIYFTSQVYLFSLEFSISFLLFLSILINLIFRVIYKSSEIFDILKDIRIIIDFCLVLIGGYLFLYITLNLTIIISKDVITFYDDVVFDALYLGYIILIILRYFLLTYIQSKKTSENNINTVSLF